MSVMQKVITTAARYMPLGVEGHRQVAARAERDHAVLVADTAAVSLRAYVPAPMIGESPMRPTGLFVSPPVDVPAARSPSLSTATAPDGAGR